MSRRNCARCSWCQPNDDSVLLADHVADAGHPVCLVCSHSLRDTDPRVCTACVARTRRVLEDITEGFALLPSMLGHPASPSYDRARRGDDETQLPGGRVLSLLGPGSNGTNSRRLTTSEAANGATGREHGADNDSDEDSVIHALVTWADDWAELRTETALGPVTVTSVVGYLSRRVQWAADEYPAFGEFLAEIQRLRQHLRIATATNDQPLRGAARCLDCEARLERTNNDPKPCRGHKPGSVCDCDRGGLDDQWHCPRCYRTYAPVDYMLAVRQQIEAAGGRDTHERHIPGKRSASYPDVVLDHRSGHGIEDSA